MNETKGINMRLFSKIFAVLMLTHLLNLSLGAKCSGKLDIGPAYAHIDVLESGHTVKRLDLGTIKADATIVPDDEYGICLKPTAMWGTGNGDLFTTGIGIGHFIPLNENLCITPSVGYTYTDIRAKINLRSLGLFNLQEKFRSNAVYLCLDGHYKFSEHWRICGAIQYAWSHSHTTISKISNHATSNCKGFNYAIMLERNVTEQFSAHIGFAYNESLTHEKHGLRGYGSKVGLAYWF